MENMSSVAELEHSGTFAVLAAIAGSASFVAAIADSATFVAALVYFAALLVAVSVFVSVCMECKLVAGMPRELAEENS